MISRLRLVLPVIQKGEEATEDEDGVSLTRAEGAQVGRALPAFLQTGRRSGGVGVEPVRSLEVAMFLCACWCVAGRTLSGRERTAPDPSFSVYTDKFSRRSLQPEAPTAVRSLSPRVLFPDDQRQIIPPLRIRDGTRRHDPSSQQEPPDAARRGARSAKAPNNCAQPAETRRCIGHPGRWC